MGFLDQPWFLNMVVEAETDLSPRATLRRIRGIERELGRKRSFKNGPRIIDIDLLLYGDVVIEDPRLVVPHPRMCERRFVLDPLVELAPQLIHPVFRRRVSDFLGGTLDQEIQKLNSPRA